MKTFLIWEPTLHRVSVNNKNAKLYNITVNHRQAIGYDGTEKCSFVETKSRVVKNSYVVIVRALGRILYFFGKTFHGVFIEKDFSVTSDYK